jgi:hypothetical protein
LCFLSSVRRMLTWTTDLPLSLIHFPCFPAFYFFLRSRVFLSDWRHLQGLLHFPSHLGCLGFLSGLDHFSQWSTCRFFFLLIRRTLAQNLASPSFFPRNPSSVTCVQLPSICSPPEHPCGWETHKVVSLNGKNANYRGLSM